MAEWNETCSQAPCNHEPSAPSVDPRDRRIAELEATIATHPTSLAAARWEALEAAAMHFNGEPQASYQGSTVYAFLRFLAQEVK